MQKNTSIFVWTYQTGHIFDPLTLWRQTGFWFVKSKILYFKDCFYILEENTSWHLIVFLGVHSAFTIPDQRWHRRYFCLKQIMKPQLLFIIIIFLLFYYFYLPHHLYLSSEPCPLSIFEIYFNNIAPIKNGTNLKNKLMRGKYFFKFLTRFSFKQHFYK